MLMIPAKHHNIPGSKEIRIHMPNAFIWSLTKAEVMERE